MKVSLKSLIGFNLALMSSWVLLFSIKTFQATNKETETLLTPLTSYDKIDNNYKDAILIQDRLSEGKEIVRNFKRNKKSLDYEWIDSVCTRPKDSVCHEVFVVKTRKVTFCSAAKVASTTTKQYFFDIADGEVKLPNDSRYGVHEADWKRLGTLEEDEWRNLLRDRDWTHIFFWKHVVERFVSGYLDKVVKTCQKHKMIESHMVLHYYVQYGFSCDKHLDIEEFLSFIETVPKLEGHFAPQTPLCSVEKYPFTDVIQVDENFSSKLQNLSSKLGVDHPIEKDETSLHRTGAKDKMVDIFKGRPDLVRRILKIFEVDCRSIPEACDVRGLMAAITQ